MGYFALETSNDPIKQLETALSNIELLLSHKNDLEKYSYLIDVAEEALNKAQAKIKSKSLDK